MGEEKGSGDRQANQRTYRDGTPKIRYRIRYRKVGDSWRILDREGFMDAPTPGAAESFFLLRNRDVVIVDLKEDK
jgi:hypothetical protein